MVFISISYAEHFERDNNKECVLDTQTKLQWQDNMDAKTVRKNYEESIAYCNNLVFAGYDDWRLPLKGEMGVIVERKNNPMYPSEFQNVIPPNHFNKYWTLSLWKGDKQSLIAGCIDFNNSANINNDFCYTGKDNKLFVRCVRLNIEEYYEKDGATKRAFDKGFDKAFQKGDFSELDAFLKDANNKKYINTIDHGYLPLHIASYKKDIVKYLIKHGGDISLKDFRGYTPLESLMKAPCRHYGEIVPCSTLEYNPKNDQELIGLLGGNHNSKPELEPDIQKIRGHVWEYVKSTRNIDNNGEILTFDKASKYCHNLKLEQLNFKIPECAELELLATKDKTIPFIYQGSFVNGVYIDFHKTPDLKPYPARYWCIDQKQKGRVYNFSTKRIDKYGSRAIIKCIEDK